MAARLESGPNNIDLLRLLGAIAVLAVHSFVLTGAATAEPSAVLFGHRADLSSLAVGMFFVFSRFLVTRSALHASFSDYVRARAARIYPGLMAVLLLQVFVLGPAMTALPAVAYLHDAGTWRALWRGLLFSPTPGLPGVFAANPVPLAVNGSLWTLRVEVACWALLAGLAPLGLLGRRGTLALLGVGLGCVLPASSLGLMPMTVVCDGTLFLAGAALFAWREAVPHRGWLAAVAGAGLVLGCRTGAAPVVICLTLPYLVLYLGLSRPVLRLAADISYGTYLYA
ncbi:MAG: hypothetical protein RQ966_06985, partial [Acetobacteraceae bacterium]|nr:hypothetical protein [Acetobacteraceae bacterium]